MRQLGSAAAVGGLFFPRSAELGLAVEDTVSPRILVKMICAGTRAASFEEASEALRELAEVKISSDRVRRACGHVGQDLADQQQQLQEAYQAKSLPEQTRGKPAGADVPQIACVMADGGRYQRLDRCHGKPGCGEPKPKQCGTARKGKHWKESRIALLAKMSGSQYEVDPQPELPQALRYTSVAEKLTEIGKTGRKLGETDDSESVEGTADEACVPCLEPREATRDHGQFAREPALSLEQLPDAVPAIGEPTVAHRIASREIRASEVDRQGIVGPTLQHRTVVASRCDWKAFGPLVASQAWYLGFAAATEKVFVSDGSSAIEKLQQTHFSHYTSVLDILHGLSYVLAAARAVSLDEAAAQRQYDAWAALVWSGRVADVISELAAHGEHLGPPPDACPESDPREVVRRSHVFLTNHQSRMDYPTYRRKGYPLTSSLMESTVKQVSRRVKGTEKFWSSPGAEAMLRLRSASLCDGRPLTAYFSRRARHAHGTRIYRQKQLAVNN
jgi:hypothetical protein